ncbi:MAG: NAD-dependent DNA ligase LigA [Minisyncoccales bacterium]
MEEKEAKERIEKLKKLINHHRYLYHVLNKEEISSQALDSLKHELYQLEQKFPQFITPDSPSQRVAGQPLPFFKKVFHKVPMLSLEDIFSEKELEEWEEYLKKFSSKEKFEYFCEQKIDGFAISLRYKNGIFFLGSTRGTGKVGEDVTQNLKTIESIPLRLEIKSKLPNEKIEKKIKELLEKGEVEIRGEVYMEKDAFKKINKELEKKGEKKYSNPRNLAAGTIRQLDPKLVKERPLKFFAYDLLTDLHQETHSQEHEILFSLGFKTDKGKVCQNLKEVISFWKETEKKRDKLPYLIDGVVVSINDNKTFQSLGVVGKTPRGQRALKFSPKEATTILEDIIVQVGRTGALTPVALLKPVMLGGVLISRATLHNEEEIKKKDLRIKDTVIVQRAGDVIPQILKPLKELRTGKEKKFRMPSSCPVCQSKIEKKGAIFYCTNRGCLAKNQRYFLHFISANAFDIVGLSEKTIARLRDEGLIQDPADLFLLKKEDLLALERFGEKSSEKLIKSIQSRKKIKFPNFIFALGIPQVGIQTAQELTKHFPQLEKLKNASEEELTKIKNIGQETSKSILKFFQEERNIKFIEKLQKVGVKIIYLKEQKEMPLTGKTFLFTGTLKSMPRKEAQRKVEELGGSFVESFSKKIDFLVAGQAPGSKLKKAKKEGIKVISEEEFLKMIK